MLVAGVNSVLITSPLETSSKAQVLHALLAQHSNHELRFVLIPEGMDVLREAIGADQQLGLLVDIDLSMGRTGTRDVETMLALIFWRHRTRALFWYSALRGASHAHRGL